jgi:hypothetical protein
VEMPFSITRQIWKVWQIWRRKRNKRLKMRKMRKNIFSMDKTGTYNRAFHPNIRLTKNNI